MRPRERSRRGPGLGVAVGAVALLHATAAGADVAAAPAPARVGPAAPAPAPAPARVELAAPAPAPAPARVEPAAPAPARVETQAISDPELQGPKPEGSHGDEVISDPELGGVKAPAQGAKTEAPAAATERPAAATSAPPSLRPEYPRETVWRITLGTRWGVDTEWARPSQDVLEGTTIGVVEAEQRRSEAFLFAVGLRVRHALGMRRGGNTRTELDVAPISAFADVTPAAGYHVRAGYQVITMGRFDVFSATNFLAVYDLRSGPVTMPDAAAIGQPALRFDFDKLDGFTLQAYYLPFFTPDIVPVYGSNYALVDRQIDAGLALAGEPTLPSFPRSALGAASSSGLRGFAPAPDLTTPQGAIRATFHGSTGELSATIGTALERLPTVGLSQRIAREFADQKFSPTDFSGEPIVHHDRFGVASVDAATDLGPIQVGAEVAYMMHRTLIATGVGSLPTPGSAPGAYSFVDHADLVQGGLRAEIVDDSGWAAAVEGTTIAALSVPSDPNFGWQTAGNLRSGSSEQGRYWAGVAGGVHFAPPDTGLRFEVAGALFSGPSYLVMPRAEWEAVKTVFLELGAAFVGGPRPTNAAISTGFFGTPNLSLGGLFSDVDQVFTGVRWVP